MAGIVALAVSYIFSQFYRSFLAVLTPVLSDELGADKSDLSMASGMWFATFALMQFVIGVSLDRFGPRRTASVLFAVGAGGGAIVFGMAQSPLMITFAMALIGVGCAPVLMASLFIFAHKFSTARFALLSSWFVALGTTGNVIGTRPLVMAIEMSGWRTTLIVLGIISIAVALAIYLLVEDPPSEKQEGVASGFGGYLQLLKMPFVWLIGPLVAINYAPAAGIRGLWAGPFLEDVYSASPEVIGNITLLMAVCMIIGSLAYGPLDTLFKTRKWVSFVGNSCTLIALVLMISFAVMPLWWAAIGLAAIGFFGSGYGLLMAHARAFYPPQLIGRGVTLMNFFSIGGVGLMQFVTGGVAEATYSRLDPHWAFSMVFLSFAIPLGIALMIYLRSEDRPPHTM